VKSERVLLDLMALDANGTTAIDFFVASRDGRYVAVALSEKGQRGRIRPRDRCAHRQATLRRGALESNTRRAAAPSPGTRKAKASSIRAIPQGAERPKEDANFYQQVWYHKLGTPASADTYAIGKEFPRIAETLPPGGAR
jgi:prolyl oligopeptidase